MRIVQPEATVVETSKQEPYEFIERVGRTCYKSESAISENSAKRFVKSLFSSQHHAMLEHYHIMIGMRSTTYQLFKECLLEQGQKDHVNLFQFINVTENVQGSIDGSSCSYVSGSFRAFIDIAKHIDVGGVGSAFICLLKDNFPTLFSEYSYLNSDILLKYCMACITWDYFKLAIDSSMSLPQFDKDAILSHHIVLSCKFVCDLLVQREFVRHRIAAFAGESTRYCNYAKDKFGSEITVMDPGFDNNSLMYQIWYDSVTTVEQAYKCLIDAGAKPDDARRVLPVSTKSELWVTATEEEWQHIINLRYHGTTGRPHPDMKKVMILAYPQLCELSNNRLN